MTRAHLTQPLYARDRHVVLPWASVRVYQADGVTPFPGPLYRDATSALTYPNPFVLAPGLVDLWFDGPVRVILGVSPDRSTIETPTPALDAVPDAAETVTTVTPLTVTGNMVATGLLRAADAATATWFPPGLSPHDHHGIAPTSTRVGPRTPMTSRVSGFPGTTSLGAGEASLADQRFFYTYEQLARRGPWAALGNETWSAWSGSIVLESSTDLAQATMLGYSALAIGYGTQAAGARSRATSGTPLPLTPGALALGYASAATEGSLSLGREATTQLTALLDGPQNIVALGRSSTGNGPDGFAAGAYACAPQTGVALGFASGCSTMTAASSIALGAHACVPSNTVDATNWVVALGSSDLPGPLAGPVIAVSPSLDVTVPGPLSLQGDVALGQRSSLLGFFGVAPVPLTAVAEEEPASGIDALDALILALREIGLLHQRHAPVVRFDAAALVRTLASGDPVASWPCATGDHVLDAGAVAPVLQGSSRSFAGAPAVSLAGDAALFDAGTIPALTHYLVVADHQQAAARPGEQLITIASAADPRHAVLSTSTSSASTFAPTMTRYGRDGLDQTANLFLGASPGGHVYRSSLGGGWPAGEILLGKTVSGSLGWNGAVTTMLGLDETWSDADVNSLTGGMAFRYRLGQDDTMLLNPARGMISSGQDPAGACPVNLDRILTGPLPGVVSGSVTIPRMIYVPSVPVVTIDPTRSPVSYLGQVSGTWTGLSPSLHQIELYVLPTPGTTPAPNYLLGRFALDVTGGWSSGPLAAGSGTKLARPVLASDHSTLPYVAQATAAGIDAQVAVYTRVGSTRTLEGIVPLRADRTWFATVANPGIVEADLIKISNTASVWGSSVRPLPQTTVGVDNASVAELALTVLALVNLDPGWHFRAQQILTRLLAVQATDGTLPSLISAAAPTTTSGDPLTSAMALSGAAALRYERVTGDTTFHAFAVAIATALVARLDTLGSPSSGITGGTSLLTIDAVQTFWLFRLLAMPEAQRVAGALRNGHWNPTLGRFHKSVTHDTVNDVLTVDSTHDLWTDLWTARYCQATRDAREPLVRQALGSFRIRGATPGKPPPLYPALTLYPSPTTNPQG